MQKEQLRQLQKLLTVKENLKIVEINCKMVIKCKKHACWTSIWLAISYCFCDALCGLWKLLNICNLRVVVQSKHSVVVAEKMMWTILLFVWKESCFWILYSITLNNRCEKMHNWKYITHVKHRGSLPNSPRQRHHFPVPTNPVNANASSRYFLDIPNIFTFYADIPQSARPGKWRESRECQTNRSQTPAISAFWKESV